MSGSTGATLALFLFGLALIIMGLLRALAVNWDQTSYDGGQAGGTFGSGVLAWIVAFLLWIIDWLIP